MRYVYLKYGDAVDELGQIGSNPRCVPECGPWHYITSFLSFRKNNPSLILSYSNRSSFLYRENVVARALPWRRRAPFRFSNLFRKIGIIFQTAYLMLSFKPDRILCAPNGPPLWVSFIVSRLKRIPLVITRHAPIEIKNRQLALCGRLCFNLDRWIIQKASFVMCHGQFLNDQLLDLGVNPNQLIRFDVSHREFFEKVINGDGHRDFLNIGTGNYILFVGRMKKEKGIFHLLNASLESLLKDPTLTLVYVGQGPDVEPLKKLIGKYTLEKQIVLAGHCSHDMIPTIVKNCFFMVSPTLSSLGEGRPKSVIEGVVAGVPVIAPNFGAFKYLIEHEVNGLLYAADSTEDLNVQILRLQHDPIIRDRLSQGARQTRKELLSAPLSFMNALQKTMA